MAHPAGRQLTRGGLAQLQMSRARRMTDPYSATMRAALTLVLVLLAETWATAGGNSDCSSCRYRWCGHHGCCPAESAKETLEQARRSADSAAVSAAGSSALRRPRKRRWASTAKRQRALQGGQRTTLSRALPRRGLAAAAQRCRPAGGVDAMARLADDWQQERKACARLLCVYMRIAPASDG